MGTAGPHSVQGVAVHTWLCSHLLHIDNLPFYLCWLQCWLAVHPCTVVFAMHIVTCVVVLLHICMHCVLVCLCAWMCGLHICILVSLFVVLLFICLLFISVFAVVWLFFVCVCLCVVLHVFCLVCSCFCLCMFRLNVACLFVWLVAAMPFGRCCLNTSLVGQSMCSWCSYAQ